MKKTISIGLVLVLFVFVSCQQHGGHGFEQATPELPVIAVEKANLSSVKSYPTSIEGTQNIAIRAKVDGYISKVYVDEGQHVKKGTLLFKLETFTLSQDAKAADAAVKSAELEVNRLIPLVEQNIVSKIQLQTAKANLERAKSEHQRIIASIEYTNIKSPVNGLVGSINFREGSLVSPSTQKELTQVSNIGDVFAFFSINEKEFISLMEETEGNSYDEKIANLPEVELVLANGTKYAQKGKIETVAGQVDKTTGAIKFRAKFPNPENVLRNGNSGRIHIPGFYNDVVAIPAQCTYEIQGMRHVYLLSADNLVQPKAISGSKIIGKHVVVEDGLKPGDKILAKGINKVRPGMTIKPIASTSQEIIDSFQTTFK